MQAHYKMSSRTAILLGRENVSKADGAIIELIKNSYDADASMCAIVFDVENDSIFIIDNGSGMNENDLVDKWLTIGTDNKKISYKSNLNRIKSGEKGIGRLALDRLGSSYKLYTKKKDDVAYYMTTTWSVFENDGLNLDDIIVNIEESNNSFFELSKIDILKEFQIDKFLSGTILWISGLRDVWTKYEVNNIFRMLGYLLPPIEQRHFSVYYKDSFFKKTMIVEPSANLEFDYKINAFFDGEIFNIDLFRNEFDLNKIPNDIFLRDFFKKSPYRRQDFENGCFKINKTVSELLNTDDQKKIIKAKEIGPFRFNYVFMKIIVSQKDLKTFFYKNISNNRTIWIKENCGIKIYRDGFMVRPYGDNFSSDAFDWLGLDARKANSPASITHDGKGWKVRNSQGQGTLLISRVSNDKILDKSSREGIIDNEHFSLLKEVLTKIISVFEVDRSSIAKQFKDYNDEIDEKKKVKEDSIKISQNILNNNNLNKKISLDEHEKLAKAVSYYKEENEELISEIKLLRSLSTNGLITTSVVHDLKNMSANFVVRAKFIQNAIDTHDSEQLNDCLVSLRESDLFLKSWISVLISQVKRDRRKRKKVPLFETINLAIRIIKPILDIKKINIKIDKDFDEIFFRMFVVDFETIFYNLIINSIESFENSSVVTRDIKIYLTKSSDIFEIIYSDNGEGLGDKFKNPYDIFDFGVTSKYDRNGEKVGTGLGMYIIASTISEYNGRYELLEYKQNFKLKISIPYSEV